MARDEVIYYPSPLFLLVFDIAITALGILPFYLILIWVLTRGYQQSSLKIFLLFLLSGLTAVPFFFLDFLGFNKEFLNLFLGPLYSIVLLAFLEEVVKSVALLIDRELEKHHYYPLLVGLGFAFFENVSYFFGFELTLTFILISLIRLFVVTSAHALFTALAAHLFKHGLKKMKTLYYVLGILFAGSAHSAFNLLNHWEMSYLIVPLLVILMVYLHEDILPVHPRQANLKLIPIHHHHPLLHPTAH